MDKKIKVIDRVVGDLMYELYISEEVLQEGLDSAVCTVKDALKDQDINTIVPAESNPKAFAGGTQTMAREGLESTIAVKNTHKGNRKPTTTIKNLYSSNRVLVAIGLLLMIIVCIFACYRWKTINHGAGSKG